MAKSLLSPLVMLFGAVVFFSANVFAASAVLGVDLGTEYIKAALVKPGIPLEIVLTKDSRRKETSAVAFKPSKAKGSPKAGEFPERLYGADAMALTARFPGEVYPNLKTLLGLPFDDASVKDYSARHPALQLQAHSTRNTATFKSDAVAASEDAWSVEELLAMELQSVQKNAEAAAGDGSTARSIVLTVPPFYTLEEKRAVRLAADLAGLKVLSLVSDGLAVGLNYATSRQFPNINEGAKPEYHLVLDMGAGSTSASVMRFQSRTVKDVGKFNKTVQEVQLLGSGWDRTLGGDALNHLIMDDMISQFVQSKGAQKISATAEGVQKHGRAMAKISKEAERVRHVLSANQNTVASFEGLYEDVDFKYKVTRTEFEAMAAGHATRIGAVIGDAVKMSGVELGDLTSIILHGGTTRTPFVQKALEGAVDSSDKIRSNVNSDEAAVFGAGFRAAELSPSFRVKEIRISEGPMYASGLKRAGADKPQRQRLWTATSPLGGAPKEMTFTDRTDFSLLFFQQFGEADREIAALSTKNLTATVAAMKKQHPTCEETEIAFKLGVKLNAENGEVQIAKAAIECEAEVTVKEGIVDGVKNLFGFGKKDQKPLTGEGEDAKEQKTEGSEEVMKEDAKDPASSSTATSSSSTETDSSATSSSSGADSTPSEEAKKEEIKRREIVSIPVEFTLEKAGVPGLTKAELTKAKDRLKSFAASDKARVQREEALNQLEAFTYKVRDLLESESFIEASTDKERASLSKKSSEIGEWLYEDGVDAAKDELKAKLKSLQDIVNPVQTRLDEAGKRPEKIEALKNVLGQTTKFLGDMRKQIADYEEYQASSSSASQSTSTSSAATESSTGDFDGLEDEDKPASSGDKAADDSEKEAGPIPPMYKSEDLDELDKLHQETEKWLNELMPKQQALAPTADPVLLISDISEKIKKLDKITLDLAMKGARAFGGKPKKTGKKKGGKKAGGKFEDFKSKMSTEELEELMEKIKKMEQEKPADKPVDKPVDKDAEKESGKETEKKPDHDEL